MSAAYLIQPAPRSVAAAEQAQSRPDPRSLLRRFAPIGLAEMDGVALQDRTDTKWVLHADLLQPILAGLADHARLLEIDGVRQHRYRSLYFDSADFVLYRTHHAGSRNRYKVRSRWYDSTDLAFLEVKHKSNTGRTIKQRIPTPALATQLAPEHHAFVQTHLPNRTAQLTPVLWNEFSRVTLVSTQQAERLTIDLDLRFWSGTGAIELPGVAVVELKQAYAGSSAFLRALREQQLRPTSFSKYCIGVSLLYPELKHNNFKQLHRLLDKLMQGVPAWP